LRDGTRVSARAQREDETDAHTAWIAQRHLRLRLLIWRRISRQGTEVGSGLAGAARKQKKHCDGAETHNGGSNS
jgi:hypothetical protein